MNHAKNDGYSLAVWQALVRAVVRCGSETSAALRPTMRMFPVGDRKSHVVGVAESAADRDGQLSFGAEFARGVEAVADADVGGDDGPVDACAFHFRYPAAGGGGRHVEQDQNVEALASVDGCGHAGGAYWPDVIEGNVGSRLE